MAGNGSVGKDMTPARQKGAPAKPVHRVLPGKTGSRPWGQVAHQFAAGFVRWGIPDCPDTCPPQRFQVMADVPDKGSAKMKIDRKIGLPAMTSWLDPPLSKPSSDRFSTELGEPASCS